MNVDDLWNIDGTGVEIFRLAMSLHRFRFLFYVVCDSMTKQQDLLEGKLIN